MPVTWVYVCRRGATAVMAHRRDPSLSWRTARPSRPGTPGPPSWSRAFQAGVVLVDRHPGRSRRCGGRRLEVKTTSRTRREFELQHIVPLRAPPGAPLGPLCRTREGWLSDCGRGARWKTHAQGTSTAFSGRSASGREQPSVERARHQGRPNQAQHSPCPHPQPKASRGRLRAVPARLSGSLKRDHDTNYGTRCRQHETGHGNEVDAIPHANLPVLKNS